MRQLLKLACMTAAFAAALGANDLRAEQPSAGKKPARLIVAFREDLAADARKSVLDQYSMKEVEALGAFNAVVAEAPGDRYHPSSMRLMSDSNVLLVEEDFTINWIKAAAFQQTPLPSLSDVMGQLPKFVKTDASDGEVPWGIARVKAEKAWALTQGEGVKVAVVDTGIDCGHPDLKGRCAGGVNYVDKAKPPMDDNSHGTHVSGTIAAVKDGKGVVGVAPKAQLYAVKVLDSEGSGSLFDIIKGLIWCANNGMQVANLSLGSPVGSTLLRLAAAYAKARGVTIVAAAGNEGGAVGYPAAYGGVIAVSALDSDDKIAEFSSRGKEVALIAPGVGIKSSVPGGKYDFYDGTSMAAPHVAGLAALAVSRGAKGHDAVLAALKKAAEPIKGLGPNEQGAGVVNAGKLVENIRNP
ncbi:MAG: S8 family peptidase [Elusimicrobia bacterium]|nr:S8 family peptidase [Elusimicrobiota bacterium]